VRVCLSAGRIPGGGGGRLQIRACELDVACEEFHCGACLCFVVVTTRSSVNSTFYKSVFWP